MSKFFNLDLDKNIDEARIELYDSMQTDDKERQRTAFENYTKAMQKAMENAAIEIINDVKEGINDDVILINRGIMKPLTSTEKKFFNEVIEKGGFENVEEVFPKSILEEIFKDLTEKHPLLSEIDCKNVGALGEYIFSDSTKAKAFWGNLTENIKKMIIEGFESIDIKSSKLSGFVPVPKSFLEMGPVWLERYVSEVIYEIMSVSLEIAIVAGTGKSQPIGMIKQTSGATDSVYPDKEKITLSNFDPISLAGIRAALAKAKTDNGNVRVIVNPITYWAKVFPYLAFKTESGVWVRTTLPTGEKIIDSYAVPENVLIFGDPKNYFLGISSDIKLNKYTETLAIEDCDLYIAKMAAYGMAKNNNAFFVADISTIQGASIPELEKFKKSTGNGKDSIITKDTRVDKEV